VPGVWLQESFSNRVRSRTLILDRGEYKTTNHRENPNCSRSRLGIVLKKLEFPSVEEFQQRVEERTETDDLSIEEVTQQMNTATAPPKPDCY